ncbi:hypothetical protein ROP_69000 [Rhodococcus opacus B4]|uniref:Uncharacterized protein n=1 Tax=Rhodococcus opacus (strain B4) TaxID=632772 RepID=C1B4F8_RHOOB|nr:hypothetical protein ROP_69000 [Rhodococcus opacus B4]
MDRHTSLRRIRVLPATSMKPLALLVEQDHTTTLDAVLFSGSLQSHRRRSPLQVGCASGRILIVEQVGRGSVALDEDLLVGEPYRFAFVEPSHRHVFEQSQRKPRQPIVHAEQGHG